MNAGSTAQIVRMANQIAANLAARGHDEAVRETAVHIRQFWDPRMRAALMAVDADELSQIAQDARRQISQDAL